MQDLQTIANAWGNWNAQRTGVSVRYTATLDTGDHDDLKGEGWMPITATPDPGQGTVTLTGYAAIVFSGRVMYGQSGQDSDGHTTWFLEVASFLQEIQQNNVTDTSGYSIVTSTPQPTTTVYANSPGYASGGERSFQVKPKLADLLKRGIRPGSRIGS